MAAKKKTIVQEFKELIDATPKAKVLTEAQFKTLEKIYEELSDVRRNLGDLEGEENISKIMFQVGSAYNSVDKCEDAVRDIINSYDDDSCEECEDDNF
jgi:DNA repair ATPase RecN